jgi:RNA polymerase sigma-70 factor (ECF subfamily)
MADSADEDLARRLAAGDALAFAALYDCHAAALYRTAWCLSGSREDAEDAVQDVFVGLVRAGLRLQAVKDVKAYLFTALRHAARKRRAQGRKHLAQPLDNVDVPGAAANSSGADDRLERAVRSLPAEQREVVVLKLDGNLTFAELGQVLGINASTAASRYRYALEKLRDALSADQP